MVVLVKAKTKGAAFRPMVMCAAGWAVGLETCGFLPASTRYPFTEIAQKGPGVLPAYPLVGAEESNQFIAIPGYFSKVLEMGENWSARKLVS